MTEETWTPGVLTRADLEEAARRLLRLKYKELQNADRGYNAARTMKQREYFMHQLAGITHDIDIMAETIWKLDILELKEIEYLEAKYHV